MEAIDADEARTQRDQLARWTEWVASEGGTELPVHIDTYFRGAQVRRVEWLKQHAQHPVLEVGCSWGYIAAHLKAEAACDINPHLVMLARFLAPERAFETVDARSLPYETDSFHTVVLAEVLEHLSWPDGVHQAVAEAKRVASAQVLVTVPNPAYDDSGAQSMKHRFLVTPEKQVEMNALLGPGIPVGPFLCYRRQV